MAMTIETTTVTVHGMRIRTVTAGAGAPLVLLHGYPVSGDLWRACIPALAARHRVYAPSLPSHGGSDGPVHAEYDLAFLVRFLEGLADALRLDRFALAAHDLGGMAALGFAARHGDRLTRLVVMDTGPYADWPLSCRLLLAMARRPLLARVLLGRTAFRTMLRMGVHRGQAMPADLAEAYRRHWVASPESRRAFSAVVALPARRWVLPEEELRAIAVPTLVLWGARDLVFGPRIAQRLSRDLPDARCVVLPRCGHFLQEDDPGAVAREIEGFLGA